MPTELERKGDFSQTVDQTGRLITVRDPLTGQAFPGNIIRSPRLDTYGVQLLKIFPLPNTTGSLRRWNFSRSAIQYHQPRRSEVAKIDYDLSPRYTLTGRYAQDS